MPKKNSQKKAEAQGSLPMPADIDLALQPNWISQSIASEKDDELESNRHTHKVRLDAIVFDLNAYPRRDADDGIKIDRDKVATLLDLLLIGKVLRPIVLMLVNGVLFLIDGFHRWEAAYRRWETAQEGKIQGMNAEEAQWIRAEFIDSIPPEIHEQVFAGTYNTVHGKNLSLQDVGRLIYLQYAHTPGMTAVEMASILNISKKTAEKYMAGPTKAFELEKFKVIEEMRKGDRPVPWKRVAELVREKRPRAKGLSDRQVQAFFKEYAEKGTVTKIALPPFLRTPTLPVHQKSEKTAANRKTKLKGGARGGDHSRREDHAPKSEKEPASALTVNVPEALPEGINNGSRDTADDPTAGSDGWGDAINPGSPTEKSINGSRSKSSASGASKEGATRSVGQVLESDAVGVKRPALDDVVQVDSDPSWVRVYVGLLPAPLLDQIRQRLYRERTSFYADHGLS